MNNRSRNFILPILFTTLMAAGAGAQKPPVTVEVFKTATCGCCAKWVEHLRNSGFATKTADVSQADLSAIKAKHSLPRALHSCHTAVVGGYVVEGHIPVSDIRKLLKERPAVSGLAVPGMPIGSPGMEGPYPQPYEVLTFDKQGRTKVFSTHGR
jgi:hypothetical protein